MTDTTSPLAPLAPAVEPRWWTGTAAVDADAFTIDGSRYRFDERDLAPDSELAIRVRQTFHEVGLVHVAGGGITDLATMRRVAQLVLGTGTDYEGGSNPRRAIVPNVYEVGAPLEAWLHYHHEMAYVGTTASAIAFLSAAALPDGRGDTFVSDNLRATDAILDTDFGRRLRDRGLCYHRDLTDRDAFAGRVEIGVYNHWQRSFGTDDPAVAEARARLQGLEVEWGPDRLMRTRYRVSAFEHFPRLDRNLLYSSVADHGAWFDAWPLVAHLPMSERPLDLTFADGEPFTADDLQTFVDVYDEYGTPLPWRTGDVAVVCNSRFAHGRPAIHLGPGERRELGVVLGDRVPRVGTVDGAW